MELSVIIVSYNVREFLRKCLDSVNEASENIDCEVFVIDNNSNDGSAEMVSREFENVKLIRNNINSGFSAANNQAIKQAKGEYILLLNPDTIIEIDAFTKCIDFMRKHPGGGALGVRMVNGQGNYLPESKRGFPTPITAFFKISGLAGLFPRSPFFNRYYLAHIDPFETAPTEVISGAFMFIRMETLLVTGLPDEDFFMYGEDIDLSYRIIRSGYINYYFPEVSIVHFKGMSTSKDRYTDIFHFYKAMRLYTHKRNKETAGIIIYLIIPSIFIIEALSLTKRFFILLFRNIKAIS